VDYRSEHLRIPQHAPLRRETKSFGLSIRSKLSLGEKARSWKAAAIAVLSGSSEPGATDSVSAREEAPGSSPSTSLVSPPQRGSTSDREAMLSNFALTTNV